MTVPIIDGYRIDSDVDRISAVYNGLEVVGARIPPGEVHWKLYLTDRLSSEFHRCHPVVCSRDGALQWIEAIAALYVAASHSSPVGGERGAASGDLTLTQPPLNLGEIA